MSKFNTLYATLAENLPVNTPTSVTQTNPQATQQATQQTNAQSAPAPGSAQTKVDANHPVVKELVAAKDSNQVIAALQKLGVK